VTISWPQSIQCLRHYDAKTFSSDLVAGLTVGLVALPLAMAFAISSGVSPENGLYCAVITGFLISALGGSKVQIGGPTGAFVVVVSGIIAKYGIEGLYTCVLMAGVILLVLGLTGMGAAVKFIPRPVVIGFTNGIALLIASTQIKDFFGLKLAVVPGEFFERMRALGGAFPTLNPNATAVAAASLLLILLIVKFAKRVPGGIIALLIGTVVVALFQLPVETIGTRFGGIPSGFPHFAIPAFHFDRALLSPALTVAMLGAIESLLSATVADRMTGDKHNPNVELFAQGIANLAAPFFGGLPATGAIARTATNIRSGGKTPVAGMIHALTILCILLFAAKWASYVPLCVLAAILLVVAYNMGEWREIPQILRLSWSDKAVWALTFGLTVFADLSVAVEFGMVFAALTFIRKVTNTTTVTRVTAEYIDSARVHILQDKSIPDYATVFRIHGPFLFGATDKIAEITDHIEELPPTVILRLRNMTAIDATGLQALEDLADRLKASGRSLILCGAREQPSELMQQAGFTRHIGVDNFCTDVEHALARAAVLHEQPH
jgi:SulP family sulfate permease